MVVKVPRWLWISLNVLASLIFLALCLTCSILVGFYGACMIQPHNGNQLIVSLSIAVPLFLGLVILAMELVLWSNRHGWDKSGIVKYSIMLLWLVITRIITASDGRLPGNDYSQASLPVPASEAEASWLALQSFVSLAGKTAPRYLDIEPESIFTNASLEASIREQWQQIEPIRTAIKQMSAFTQIADLQKLSDTNAFLFLPIRNAGYAYHNYSALCMQQGDPEEGARALGEWHTFVRKTFRYSRPLVRKMIGSSLCMANISTAFMLSSNSNCTSAARSILQKDFSPLEYEEISLHTAFLYEYLTLRERMLNLKAADMVPADFSYYQNNASTGLRYRVECGLLKLGYALLFRRNDTVRLIMETWTPRISNWERLPPSARFEEFETPVTGLPEWGNLLGWLYIVNNQPSFVRAQGGVLRAKIYSDILAIELQSRQGNTLALPDPYARRNYLLNATNGIHFSVGPDHAPDTSDDISLPMDFMH